MSKQSRQVPVSTTRITLPPLKFAAAQPVASQANYFSAFPISESWFPKPNKHSSANQPEHRVNAKASTDRLPPAMAQLLVSISKDTTRKTSWRS